VTPEGIRIIHDFSSGSMVQLGTKPSSTETAPVNKNGGPKKDSRKATGSPVTLPMFTSTWNTISKLLTWSELPLVAVLAPPVPCLATIGGTRIVLDERDRNLIERDIRSTG